MASEHSSNRFIVELSVDNKYWTTVCEECGGAKNLLEVLNQAAGQTCAARLIDDQAQLFVFRWFCDTFIEAVTMRRRLEKRHYLFNATMREEISMVAPLWEPSEAK